MSRRIARLCCRTSLSNHPFVGEFRYLRTVRVTAAVYRGFHSKLITLLLPTFQHRAGVRLYTSCYHLAESCVFNKQSLPPGMCRFPNLKIGKHPFSRSYGVILPSSLTRVLSLTLGFSPRLPVSVCGTGTSRLARGFSWQCGIRNFGTIIPSSSQLSLYDERICLLISLTA